MKALVYYGPHDIRYEEVATPVPGENEVLVKVKAVSICGSDVSGYKGESAMRVPPLIMGHEFSGKIAALGPGVRKLHVGDRVGVLTNLYCGKCRDCETGLSNVCNYRKIIGTTMLAGSCNGAMAEYVAVPAEKIMVLPDKISFYDCALIEPLAIALRATKHAGILKGKTVVVYGAGPIGLLTIKTVCSFGAEKVIAIGHHNLARLEKARDCGAAEIIQNQNNLPQIFFDRTGEEVVDVVFDAVGVMQTVNGSIDIVRNGGMIIWIGLASQKLEIDFKKAVCKEITFKSSYMYTTEMEESLELVASDVIRVNDIITGIYPLKEGPGIFNNIVNGSNQDIKILLTP